MRKHFVSVFALCRTFTLPSIKGKDGREHYTFIETPASTDGKRNPHVFCGEFITVTRWTDGSLHPNFKPTRIGGKGFNLTSYAWGVACELREALKGLIEERTYRRKAA